MSCVLRMGQEEVFIHAEKDKNVHVKHDNTTFVGNDRIEKVEHDENIEIGHDRAENVANDETVNIGRDQRHAVARDRFHSIGHDHEITIDNNRIECVGNERHDKTGTNHHIQTGGNVDHKVQSDYRLSAGRSIEQKTTCFEVKAGQRIVLKAPGGTLILDESGITLDGLLINIKGLVESANGANASNSWWGQGSPQTGNLQEFFILREADTGEPLPDRPYEIVRGSGHILRT
jgi:type VI secretion system secreted protein VgrG